MDWISSADVPDTSVAMLQMYWCVSFNMCVCCGTIYVPSLIDTVITDWQTWESNPERTKGCCRVTAVTLTWSHCYFLPPPTPISDHKGQIVLGLSGFVCMYVFQQTNYKYTVFIFCSYFSHIPWENCEMVSVLNTLGPWPSDPGWPHQFLTGISFAPPVDVFWTDNVRYSSSKALYCCCCNLSTSDF